MAVGNLLSALLLKISTHIYSKTLIAHLQWFIGHELRLLNRKLHGFSPPTIISGDVLYVNVGYKFTPCTISSTNGMVTCKVYGL